LSLGDKLLERPMSRKERKREMAGMRAPTKTPGKNAKEKVKEHVEEKEAETTPTSRYNGGKKTKRKAGRGAKRAAVTMIVATTSGKNAISSANKATAKKAGKNAKGANAKNVVVAPNNRGKNKQPSRVLNQSAAVINKQSYLLKQPPVVLHIAKANPKAKPTSSAGTDLGGVAPDKALNKRSSVERVTKKRKRQHRSQEVRPPKKKVKGKKKKLQQLQKHSPQTQQQRQGKKQQPPPSASAASIAAAGGATHSPSAVANVGDKSDANPRQKRFWTISNLERTRSTLSERRGEAAESNSAQSRDNCAIISVARDGDPQKNALKKSDETFRKNGPMKKTSVKGGLTSGQEEERSNKECELIILDDSSSEGGSDGAKVDGGEEERLRTRRKPTPENLVATAPLSSFDDDDRGVDTGGFGIDERKEDGNGDTGGGDQKDDSSIEDDGIDEDASALKIRKVFDVVGQTIDDNSLERISGGTNEKVYRGCAVEPEEYAAVPEDEDAMAAMLERDLFCTIDRMIEIDARWKAEINGSVTTLSSHGKCVWHEGNGPMGEAVVGKANDRTGLLIGSSNVDETLSNTNADDNYGIDIGKRRGTSIARAGYIRMMASVTWALRWICWMPRRVSWSVMVRSNFVSEGRAASLFCREAWKSKTQKTDIIAA